MMTRLSERGPGATGRATARRRLRHPKLIAALLTVALLVVGGALFTAHQLGVFARGPAVDATTVYLTALQRQDYPAAYAMLAPDLRAREPEDVFGASMQQIAALDGALTSFHVRDSHSSDTIVVVTVEVSRANRGTFMIRVQLRQDAGNQWRVTGGDDL